MKWRPSDGAFRLAAAAVTVFAGAAGCADAGERFSAVGMSRGVLEVGLSWRTAALKADPGRLVSLFWDGCLMRCRGFRFAAAGTAMGGTVGVYRWVERKVSGSLVWDLAGQMASYQKVTRAQVLPVDLRFHGERVAVARFRIHVDGVLKTGQRRSDRGEVELWLENRGLGTRWWITGMKLKDMFTVVALKPGFRDMTRRFGLSGLAPGRIRAGRMHARPAPGRLSGPGMALSDLDGDGRVDLFLASENGGRLYLNRGSDRFDARPALVASGRRNHPGGVTVADLDGDGKEDLFVAFRNGGNVAFLNRGSGRFQPAVRPPGFVRVRGTVAAVFTDANGDGLLDAYLVNHTTDGGSAGGEPDQLWLSTGPGVWETKPVHVSEPGRSRAACVVGPAEAPGLVVVEDFGARFLKPFGGRSSMRMSMESVRVARMMGSSCLSADLRPNGEEDVLLVGVRSRWSWLFAQPSFPAPVSAAFARHRWISSLQRAGRGSLLLRGGWLADGFKSGGRTVGSFAEPDVLPPDLSGWDRMARAADVDNDGALELAVLSGTDAGTGPACLGPAFWATAFPRIWQRRRWGAVPAEKNCYGEQPSVRLLWRASSGTWVDLAFVLGLEIEPGNPGTWLSFADLDGDGAADLVLRHADGSVRVYVNVVPQGGSFTLKIVGPESNRSSVGAVVRVFVDGSPRPLVRRVTAEPGASKSGLVTIGLGTGRSARVAHVRWPDGRRASMSGPQPSIQYRLRWSAAKVGRAGPAARPRPVRPEQRFLPAGPFLGPRPSGPARPARPVRPVGRPSVRGAARAGGSRLGPSVLPAERWAAVGRTAVSLRGLRGTRATVVQLWPPWCRGCAKQAKVVAGWAAKRKGVRVVVVHIQDPCVQYGKGKCAIPPRGVTHLVMPTRLRQTLVLGAALPRTLVYDQAGRLRTVLLGPPDTHQLDRAAGSGPAAAP